MQEKICNDLQIHPEYNSKRCKYPYTIENSRQHIGATFLQCGQDAACKLDMHAVATLPLQMWGSRLLTLLGAYRRGAGAD